MPSQPLLLTLQLIAASVAIAAVIGIVGAWAMAALARAGRIGKLLSTWCWLALLTAIAMPLVLHAAGWEATAGKFGWWVMTQTGARTAGFGAMNGLFGTAWVHGLYGAAIVALAVAYGTTQTPASVVRQSRLDMGPVRRWWWIRLPIAAPWLVASLLATAVLAAAEMTVADLFGYRTIADTFYLYYAVDPSPAQILWACVLPWAAAAALLVSLFVGQRRVFSVQASPTSEVSEQPPSGITGLAVVIAISVAAVIVVVPVAGLVVKAGHTVLVVGGELDSSWSLSACARHFSEAPSLFASEYRWTLVIAVATGLTSLVAAWPLAAWGRVRPNCQNWIDVASVLVFAVPGPVVGMAITQSFQQPLPGFAFLYGQTIVPTVIALSVRAIPIAYWVLRSGYSGIGDGALDLAKMDLSFPIRVWMVDRLLLSRHLLIAFAAAAVFASGDVPAMLPVIPAGVTTVGTRLFELLHAGARYQEASLAFWYVAAVVIVASTLRVLWPDRKSKLS